MQVGKTTSSPGNHQDPTIASVYLDLESPFNHNKLSYPELYLESHQDKLVILDEIYRFPELFEILRGNRLGTTARVQNRPFSTSRFGLNGTLYGNPGSHSPGGFPSTYLERDIPLIETLLNLWSGT